MAGTLGRGLGPGNLKRKDQEQTRKPMSMEKGATQSKVRSGLIAALDAGQSTVPEASPDAERSTPRFLKLEVNAIGEDGKDEGLRMRVPLDLLRAGIKMRALIPKAKRDRINEKLKEKGIEGDVFDMSNDQIDDLIRSMCELEIEAGDGEGGLRIFLE